MYNSIEKRIDDKLMQYHLDHGIWPQRIVLGHAQLAELRNVGISTTTFRGIDIMHSTELDRLEVR